MLPDWFNTASLWMGSEVYKFYSDEEIKLKVN